jgi:nucleoside-diphosphate kinase
MSRSVTDARLAFNATHEDVASGLTRHFLCLFFHGDNTVELIDEQSTRTFLKRTYCPNISTEQFFLGSDIVIFGRVLHLTSYIDKVTEQLCEKVAESTVVVVHEDAFPHMGDLLDVAVVECGFNICELQVVQLTKADVKNYQGEVINQGAAMLPARFIGVRVAVITFIRDKAVEKAQTLAARLGMEADVVAAATKAEAATLSTIYPIAKARPSALMAEGGAQSSVVIIKPDVVGASRGGAVLQTLLREAGRQLRGVQLVALSQFTLSTLQAEAFLNVYKGILPEYRLIVDNLASGALWVAQFTAEDEGVGHVMREVCGPVDPVIAKVLRPATIRAKLGVDAVRNVVHCSDLPEDGAADAAFLWSLP